MRWGLLGASLGVLLGVAVGKLWVHLWLDAMRRPEHTVMVIVAALDVPAGEHITEDDLYAIQIPPRFLPEHVLLSPDHVVGARTTEDVLANEFIRAERLEYGAANALVRVRIPCHRREAGACASGLALLPELVGNGTAYELELVAWWVAQMPGPPDDVSRLKARLLEAAANAADERNPTRCDRAAVAWAALPAEAPSVVWDEESGRCRGARALEVSEFTALLAEVTTR